MDRYFFDLDGVPDKCGMTMPSATTACVEALMSMPEYVSEVLERDGGKVEVTCGIRENDDSAASYKIVVVMHVEDASGTIILPPFKLPGLVVREISARERSVLEKSSKSWRLVAVRRSGANASDRAPRGPSRISGTSDLIALI